MRWKYPFQPSVDAVFDKHDGVTEEERDEAPHKPVAKPRAKVIAASERLQNIDISVQGDVDPSVNGLQTQPLRRETKERKPAA